MKLLSKKKFSRILNNFKRLDTDPITISVKISDTELQKLLYKSMRKAYKKYPNHQLNFLKNTIYNFEKLIKENYILF